MEPKVRWDFNELLTPMLGAAEEMLSQTGAFRPFGARVASGGQVAMIDVTPNAVDPSGPLVMDALYATFRLEARAGTIRACGVCWDAKVPSEDGRGLTDAIAIGLEHRDADPTVVVCTYERDLRGGLHFAEPISSAGARHVFGDVRFC